MAHGSAPVCAAETLGLPTTGSANQLRQLIKGCVQQERDYKSVAVLEWESLKVEYVLALEDCDGEFAQTAPAYWEPPAQQDRAQWAEELRMVHAQLDVANGIIRTVNRREGTSPEDR